MALKFNIFTGTLDLYNPTLGDVAGPGSATDNAIARFDGITGKTIQNSGASIDDTGNISALNLSGTNTGDQTITLTSDVTGSGTSSFATTVVSVGGSSAANINSAELAANAATNLNTISTIVKRDASGNFSAGTITAGQLIDSGLTANTVPYADASKQLTSSSVTPTELGYVSGVTSAIQTQIDSKISGPVSSTDNAIARFDGTTGKLEQNSLAILDDLGALSGLTQLDTDNIRIDGNIISSTNVNGEIDLSPNGSGKVKVENSNGIIELGSLDAFSRTQIWNKGTSAIARIGASTGDGDSSNVQSEGIIVYGPNDAADPMGNNDYSYARIKYDRLGLLNSDLGVGSNIYIFRVDPSNLRMRDNAGNLTLDIVRSTGATTFYNTVTLAQDPTLALQAATKSYVDNVAEGLKPKQAVRVGTTANITLSGEQTIDGILTSADRVLVKDQTTTSQNGIYVSAAGAWTRATDFDSLTPIDEINGAYTFIQEGTTQEGQGWVQQGTVTTLDTDPIVFVFFNSVAGIIGGDMITVTGSTISVDLATSSALESSNPGNNAGQLRVKLETSNPTLQIDGSNQLGSKLDGTRAITTGASGIGVNVDNSTIDIATNAIQVKTGGITNTQVSASAAIATSKLADATALAESVTFFNSTDISGAEAETLTNGSDASSLHNHDNSYPSSVTGDINETSFSAANNQTLAANVTGLLFSNASVRSAKIQLSSFIDATGDLYEEFELRVIQRGADWVISSNSIGDDSGLVFSITTAGQVQYTSTNITGFVSNTIKFRATVTSL